MNARQRILQWQQQAKIRQLLIILAAALPVLVGLYFLAARFISPAMAWIAMATGALCLIVVARAAMKKLDRLWLIRQLDERFKTLENSADLVFADAAPLSTLQGLQRQRIEQKIQTIHGVDLRKAWPWKAIFVSLWVALLMILATLYFPSATKIATQSGAKFDTASLQPAGPIRLLEASISMASPSYTGLPARTENALNVKFPEGSRLQWRMRFAPQPQRVSIRFFDGSELPLQRQGENWVASKSVHQSDLYRVEIDGKRLAAGKRFRLDAIKDLPPQMRVMQPDRSLSIMDFEQKQWPLEFEASDDYGLGAARLRVQLAQGAGENITFSERTIALNGQGGNLRKRFAHRLDLSALGLAEGDDVIVQFSVDDRRAPQANTTRSSSYILRWPPEDTAPVTGTEGILKKLVPAYFRSQRQIIIDTEKLLAERKKLSKENFEIRSDSIGVDQRLLRLRYGQFLGEESESGRASGVTDPASKDNPQEHVDEHAQDEPVKKASISEAASNQAILEQFGHTHDIAEAATLLDSKTKELLRAALNEMWQAELNLRQAQPSKALPYEYRALGFIKQVQQASRIYLARVGSELPPIDETRRMSGDRAGLQDRNDWLQASNASDQALTEFWRALDVSGPMAGSPKPDVAAMLAWINSNPERVADPLSVKAALDDYQTQPDCASCVLALKARLWLLLAKPAAAPVPRNAPSKMGRAYLDALRKEAQP